MRAGLFRVALLSFSLCMTIGVGECFIRVASPQPVSWLAIYRSHPVLPFFSMLPNETLHVDTGETEWTVKTDGQGFRVGDVAHPEGHGCTMLWLGDSFTLGHGVDYDESYVGLIEARTPSVRHINSAVAGYGPVQYRHTLEYLGEAGMDFDSIVVGTFVGNDFHDTQWDKNPIVEEGILGNDAGFKSFLKRNLHLYRLLTAAHHRLAGADEGDHEPTDGDLARSGAWQEDFLSKAVERYALEMSAIQAYADEHGKGAVFVIVPTREAAADAFAEFGERAGETDATEEAENAIRPKLPVERARAIFDEIGAQVLDLTPTLGERSPEEMFFHFDGHLTPKANERVADAFVRAFGSSCPVSAVSR